MKTFYSLLLYLVLALVCCNDTRMVTDPSPKVAPDFNRRLRHQHHHHHHYHQSHPDQLYSHDHSLLDQFNATSASVRSVNYCPASSLINFEVSGYFNYPLTFFADGKKKQSISNADIRVKTSLFNCTTRRPQILNCDGEYCNDKPDGCLESLRCPHICSPQVQIKCPLSSKVLDAAFNRSSAWVYNVSEPTETLPLFFHMRQILSDPTERVRLLIFGGSAAIGAEASGCFCDLEYDSKCVGFNHTSFTKNHKPLFGEERDCKWLNYFVTWLRSISAASIEIVDFIHPGSNPDIGARHFIERFSGNNAVKDQLTANDIVILDYSMNDARTFTETELLHDQQSRLEFLIQTIYNFTESNSTAWPVIIQTETWPYPCGFCWKETHHMDYASVYTKVMQHYKLPIFSFKDALWSDYMKTNHPELQRALAYKESHPLWPHHIYFADLYAGLFSRELKRAYHFHESMMRANFSGDTQAYEKHLEIVRTQSKPAVPPPLSTFEVVDFCSAKHRPHLDLEATDYASDASLHRKDKARGSYAVIAPPFNSSDVEKMSSEPINGWKVIDDKKGRFGWIDELPKMRTGQPPSNTLIFFLGDSWDSVMGGGGNVLVSIQYLRTYLNAGRAHVYVCGYNNDSPFLTMEAFWEYPPRQISIPQYLMRSFKVEDVDKTKCLERLNKYQPFQSIIPPSSGSNDITKPVIWSEKMEAIPAIIIEHEVITGFSYGEWEVKSRSTQKVKISSIKVCRKDN